MNGYWNTPDLFIRAMRPTGRLEALAMDGSLPTLQRIIALYPERINTLGTTGTTLLGVAALAGQPHVVEWLIRVAPHLADNVDENGLTPLDLAIESGNQAVIELISANFPQLVAARMKARKNKLLGL